LTPSTSYLLWILHHHHRQTLSFLHSFIPSFLPF
jgi:hypothetical protein